MHLRRHAQRFPLYNKSRQRETIKRSWADCRRGIFPTVRTSGHAHNRHGILDGADCHQRVRMSRSAQSTKNGANTDELLNVANQEMMAAGSGPMIILGHFNTDFDSSPAMKRLTTLLGWIDAASPPPPINQKPPRSVLPNAAITGESPAAPGRAQREPLDSGCLARHGASVGTPMREVSNVSQVTDTTEAMTKRTKHVNVTELHAICFLVTDSVPTHHLVKQIPLDPQITRTHVLQKQMWNAK